MSRGVRIRLGAFVVLSAVGLIYITASYLGLIDKITGRELTVTATLPNSGGLYVGSEVTYRGVKIGKVAKVVPTATGIDVSLVLKEDTKLPTDSPMFVHNLSAVGDQYLDVRPRGDGGPFLADGATVPVEVTSVPLTVPEVLAHAQSLMSSLDVADIQTIADETATIFGSAEEDVDLRALAIEMETAFAMLRRLEPTLTRLIRTAETPLRTLDALAPQLRSIAADLEATYGYVQVVDETTVVTSRRVAELCEERTVRGEFFRRLVAERGKQAA